MAERNRKTTEILLFLLSIFIVVVCGLNVTYYYNIYNSTVTPTSIDQTNAFYWMNVNIALLVVACIYLFYRAWSFFFSWDLTQSLKERIAELNSNAEPWRGLIGPNGEFSSKKKDEKAYVPFFGPTGILTSNTVNKPSYTPRDTSYFTTPSSGRSASVATNGSASALGRYGPMTSVNQFT